MKQEKFLAHIFATQLKLDSNDINDLIEDIYNCPINRTLRFWNLSSDSRRPGFGADSRFQSRYGSRPVFYPFPEKLMMSERTQFKTHNKIKTLIYDFVDDFVDEIRLKVAAENMEFVDFANSFNDTVEIIWYTNFSIYFLKCRRHFSAMKIKGPEIAGDVDCPDTYK